MSFHHEAPTSEPTDAQYLAIGKLVVEWSGIEYMLSVLLARLLRTPEFLARTYADSLSAVRMQAAIDEAVEIHRQRYGMRFVAPTDLLTIESLNVRITALRSQRNKLSHFVWLRMSDNELFGTAMAGGVPSPKKERRTQQSISLTELNDLHTEAWAVTEELMQVCNRLPEVLE